MPGVTAQISSVIEATVTGAGDLASPKQRVSINRALQLIPGTDAVNKADVLFSDSRNLAASANENIDLRGVLEDAFGATVNAAEIVAIYIAASDGNTNNVNVTRPASNGFAGPFLAAGDGLSVRPGEWIMFASQSGWAVTAATGDLINIANSADETDVDYDIVVIGRTVAA